MALTTQQKIDALQKKAVKEKAIVDEKKAIKAAQDRLKKLKGK